MAQPAGISSIKPEWLAKGLRSGIYLTQNGAFVFDEGGAVTAANGAFVPSAANTETTTPNGDRAYKAIGTGGTGFGATYSGAVGTFQAAFGASKTFVLDARMVPSGPGNAPGTFFRAGNSAAGEVSVVARNISATETEIDMSIADQSYGGRTSSTYRITGTNAKRIAFRHVTGSFIDVFVDGVKVEPYSKSNNAIGSTAAQNEPRQLFEQAAYSIAPSGSHLLIFDTALSDADILSLSTDPWSVFGTGTPPTGTVTISDVTKTTTSATATYSYSAADATGYEYRVNGGAAVALGASPATVTGLTASTAYALQIRATNASGASAWSTAYNFSTNSPVVARITLPPIKNNAGTLLANEAGITVIVNTLTGAHVVTKTGQASDASGVITVQDASMTQGTTYRALIILSSGAEGLAKVVAS